MAKDDQKPSTGMILGKFMPPHRGHQYLIDFARERVDRLTIIVSSTSGEPIPGRLRFEWVSELYPESNVVHLTDENPQEPHEHPRFWEIWTASIRRFLPGGPDYVFTSEAYGDELARNLGARHILLDEARSRVPVSATMIRSDPFGCWQHIPPCVRPYFVKRVAIVGAESTGKTTLAEQLARHYQTVWAPEYGRVYLDLKDSPCELEDISHIARGHMEGEERLAREANRVLILDTELIITTLWSEYFFSECPDWVRREASERSYDLYLLTANDVPWIADPQRVGPESRDTFYERLRRELGWRGRRFAVVRGGYEQRLEQAIRAVDSLFKNQTGGL
jgi:NadR type nicotinamide-nucleotide adenylyltransferase